MVLRPVSGRIGRRAFAGTFLTALAFTVLTAVSVYGANEYLKKLTGRGKNTENT